MEKAYHTITNGKTVLLVCIPGFKILYFQIQFGLLALHYFVLLFKSWLVPDCTFPLWPMYIILPQNLFIFLLFADFYRKNYLLKAKVN